MRFDLKIALIQRFGSQIAAARPLKIEESKLSKIVRGHRDPSPAERKRLTAMLGVDYFEERPEEEQRA